MNINVSLIEQRLVGIIDKYPQLLPDVKDEAKKKSSAFILLCMSTLLDVSLEQAAEYFTDGGNDAGVDGIYVEDVEDGELCITIFQGKYKSKLDGEGHFPENGIIKAIDTVGTLFDPAKDVAMNEQLKPKIEEIRSLIRDGYIPVIRFVLCNNGLKWNDQAQAKINHANFPPEQVSWCHFNHDSIIEIMQKTRKVDASLLFSGKAIHESFNFKRVLLGKVPVEEIAVLLEVHGDLLLERNIRRFLGIRGNRVNSAISETLKDPAKRDDFYFFNNGITIICRKFRHNALQDDNPIVTMKDIQIINGGQISKTIHETIHDLKEQSDSRDFSNCFVMVRIYELEEDNGDFVRDITYATNSQNPVDLHDLYDLHSNDQIQKSLALGMKELGYTYKRHREDSSHDSHTITSSAVAEAVLAVWRASPHQAKFMRNEHFGKLYNKIFNNLNAAEAIIAVLILRKVENLRKRPTVNHSPDFLPYASQYLAMLIGGDIFLDSKISIQNFSESLSMLEQRFVAHYNFSIGFIDFALRGLYQENAISLQQLSATFRRGDLLDYIARKRENASQEIVSKG